jgi:hypothetical protein
MPEPVDPISIPTRALIVLYALATMTRAGATYRGLSYALGIKSERALHRHVACAEGLGLVKVIRNKVGRGNKAIVQIQHEGFRILSTLRH